MSFLCLLSTQPPENHGPMNPLCWKLRLVIIAARCCDVGQLAGLGHLLTFKGAIRR
jgi:hypothetical protein